MKYVIATKYSDGDPNDQWCVGFLSQMLGDRYIVVDNNGIPFRASGFRKIKEITREQGDLLLKTIPKDGCNSGFSIWEMDILK